MKPKSVKELIQQYSQAKVLHANRLSLNDEISGVRIITRQDLINSMIRKYA